VLLAIDFYATKPIEVLFWLMLGSMPLFYDRSVLLLDVFSSSLFRLS